MTGDQKIKLSEHTGKVVLKDGSTMLFRPIKQSDAQAWMFFYRKLSEHADCLRLQRVPRDLNYEDALRYCTIDYYNQFALVAEIIESRQRHIVAVGRYTRLPDPKIADISFVVLDSYQNKGIGAKLIEWLATVAGKSGIDPDGGLGMHHEAYRETGRRSKPSRDVTPSG